MNTKRIIAIVIFIIGLALMGVSSYIKGRVAEGKAQISDAQEKVDTGNTLFSMSPATKAIGEELSGSVQKKIDAGSEEAAHYEQIARYLQIAGILLVVIGAGVWWTCPKKK